MGVKAIGRDRVQQLMSDGAQIVEVLEAQQYRQAHLPGAIHIPAWELTRERAGEGLVRDRRNPGRDRRGR